MDNKKTLSEQEIKDLKEKLKKGIDELSDKQLEAIAGGYDAGADAIAAMLDMIFGTDDSEPGGSSGSW